MSMISNEEYGRSQTVRTSPYGGSVEEGIFAIAEDRLRERIASYANEHNLCEEGIVMFCKDIGIRPPGRRATIRFRIEVDVEVFSQDGVIDEDTVGREFTNNIEAHLGRNPLGDYEAGDVETCEVYTISISDADWMD